MKPVTPHRYKMPEELEKRIHNIRAFTSSHQDFVQAKIDEQQQLLNLLKTPSPQRRRASGARTPPPVPPEAVVSPPNGRAGSTTPRGSPPKAVNTTVVAVQTSRPVDRAPPSLDETAPQAAAAAAATIVAPAASSEPWPSPAAAIAESAAESQQTELHRLRQTNASLQEAHEAQALRHAAQVRQHKAELDKFQQQHEQKDAEIRLLKESQVELQRMLLSQVNAAEDDVGSDPRPREVELEEANRALKANLESLHSHIEKLEKEHTSLEEELLEATKTIHDDEMVEELMTQKDNTIEQLQQALAQSEADVAAAEEGQREAREEVAVLTEALSTVQDQLNLLRGRWNQYREDVENEVAMLDCHIGDVCTAAGAGQTIDAPSSAANAGVTPEKLNRFASAGSSAMHSIAAVSGSPPVANSPGFFEEGSVADSSLLSSTAGDMDDVDDHPEEDAQQPNALGQQNTMATTEEDEKKLGLLSLRDRVKAIQSELGTQHDMEQQEMLQLQGLIKSAEDVPPPPEQHQPTDVTVGSSFNTNTTAGTTDSSLNHPGDSETSMRTTTAQMGDEDIPKLSSLEERVTDVSSPASPSSPEVVGRATGSEDEPAGTPPDESVGFAMAAEALRAEMEASMNMGISTETNESSRTKGYPLVNMTNTAGTLGSAAVVGETHRHHDSKPVSPSAQAQHAQMGGDVVRLGPRALQALEREGTRQHLSSSKKEKRKDDEKAVQRPKSAESDEDDLGDDIEASQSTSDLGTSIEDQLAESQREKDAMVAEVAEMKRKYAKMKLKYKNQASVQASVNQALLALESNVVSQDDGRAFSDVSSINSEQEQTLHNVGLVHQWNRNHVEDGISCSSTPTKDELNGTMIDGMAVGTMSSEDSLQFGSTPEKLTDMPDEAETGRNLRNSFLAASFGADDKLAEECDEEVQELQQIGFHISVTKDGKVSSRGISNISTGSSPGKGATSKGTKRRPSSASTSTIRRMAHHNAAHTSAGPKLKLTRAGGDSATATRMSSAEKIKGGGPSSVVKPPRGRRRPLKQQNSNVKIHTNDNALDVGSRSSGSPSKQQTSRRRTSGIDGRIGHVPTPEKAKMRRKSPRKAAASKGSGHN